MSEYHYKQLLKEQAREFPIDNNVVTRKRRRTNRAEDYKEPSSINAKSQEIINISDSETKQSDDSFDSDDFEDVDLGGEDNQYSYNLNEETSDNTTNGTITITLSRPEEESKKRKFAPISKGERDLRKLIHQLYLVTMILHGSIRNKWCNDYSLLMKLRSIVPHPILGLLNQNENDNVLDSVRSRRFLDGLQKVMHIYSQKFRVTSKGLVRKNWNELSIKQTKTEKNVTFEKFKSLITAFRGSRDIGAQGFVCLLRAIGLNARLVFSLQPPDFTSISSFPKIDSESIKDSTKESVQDKPKQNSLIARFRPKDNKSKLLSSFREKSTNVTVDQPSMYTFEDSPYPIFWAEVWNKYSKKWISIDSIVLKLVESPPMRRKSKFEPPLTEPRNQLIYVIAYDRLGGVKDVTRRYNQYYNARTIKKKIHFRSEEDQNWYNGVLKASCAPIRRSKMNKLDILELKEFHERDLAEGIPNNIADFKNHPVYALESQLKQNEIIYPKDETSKCGIFRNKTAGRSKKNVPEVIPIYKRSHIHSLKSAKAWYMNGRVLKVGAQPLKIRKKRAYSKNRTPGENGEDEEDDDGVTRLYAEFQTQLYISPPIIDGKIPKNPYGNIEIFTPTMIPENGYLIETIGKFSMKIAEKAAKSILEIDYAKAIIAFDFGKSGNKRSHSRTPTVKEGGLLIDIQYKEAMFAVMDSLLEEEEKLQREQVELNSLRNWKYFLTKLRISERLNKQHGKIDNKNEPIKYSDESNADNYSVYSDTSGSDLDVAPGGFIADAKSESALKFSEDTPRYVHDEFVENEESVDKHPKFNSESKRYKNDGMYTVINNHNLEDELAHNKPNVVENLSDYSEDFGGGGFFVKDSKVVANTIESDPQDQENVLDDNDFLEELPDKFFKQDENGELIYDPNADESDVDLEHVASIKSNSSIELNNTSDGLLENCSCLNNDHHEIHGTSLKQSPNTTSSFMTSKEDVTNKIASETPLSNDHDQLLLNNNSVQHVEISLSNPGESDKDIDEGSFSTSIRSDELAKEEEAFAFEYSDSE